MRIAFVWDWDIVPSQTITWQDGLAAAVRELRKRHEVKLWTCGGDYVFPHPYFPIHVSTKIVEEVKEFKPDKILIWGDCTRPHIKALYGIAPIGLLFAGGHMDQAEGFPFVDHFFVESQVYKDRLEAFGRSVSTAFGTNTDLFTPLEIPKQFDAFLPATFATWKRHELFAEATKGMRAVAAGWMYEGREEDPWKLCDKAGVLALPHLSLKAIKRLYAASKCVVIPSRPDGGSQRSVLEAMAMNIPVIVCSDSDKTTEYVREGGGLVVEPKAEAIREAIFKVQDQTFNTRDYILSKWSHINYANQIEQWLLQQA